MAYAKTRNRNRRLKKKVLSFITNALWAIFAGLVVVFICWFVVYLSELSEVDRDPKRSIFQSADPISGYDQVDEWIVEAEGLPKSKAKADFLDSIEDSLDSGKLSLHEFNVLTKKHQRLMNFEGITRIREVLDKTGDDYAK